MMIKTASCLLALGFLAGCETTTTTKHETLQQKTAASYANAPAQPAPPAEGPEDVPAGSSMNPIDNPALVPTPLLRDSAARDL
jgi:hypothetical protein